MNFEGLSGPWKCRWTQRGRTELETLDLVFQDGQVLGFGSDPDGEFQYSGQSHPDGSVSLTKVYTSPLIQVPSSLTYIGAWDGRRIAGEWMDDMYPGRNHGPFRMWPGKQAEPSIEEAKEEPLKGSGSLEGELVRVLSRPTGTRNGTTSEEP
ncbi:MAG: hypothetical protein BWY56_01814 [Acidobacteria bacterium ADurb.Bin340]|nr:MAG: hypothetical protein BWY56_01814 [Acidobacteria bacterium ADurb.Bin340]